MNAWSIPVAFAALALLAACENVANPFEATPPNISPEERAARNACRTQAQAAGATAEGSGMRGSQDYDHYVADCMRAKGFPQRP